MSDAHPSRELLERFVRADLTAAQTGEVLRHLLTGCADCKEFTAALWDFAEAEDDDAVLAGLAPELDAAYDRMFDAAFHSLDVRQGELEHERAAAAQLWEELEHHPATRQEMLVRNSARFASPSLCELFLEKGRDACFHDPQRAIELAHLATVIAERVEGQDDSVLRHGLAARAWAALCNAQRILGDHAAAERSIATAEGLLDERGG